MKKLISLLALAALTVAATAQIKNFETSSIYKTATRTYLAQDTTLAADDGHDAIYSVIAVGLQWPVKFGDNDVTALQDTLLMRAFGVKDMGVDEAINEYLSQPAGREEYTLNLVADIDMERCGQRLMKRVDVSTVGFCERYIVYECSYFEYTGGDHPNYFSHYINYDVTRNKMLMFNDIFAPGTKERLGEVVLQALLDKFYATSLEDLYNKTEIHNEFHVSRDIYLTGNEIVFRYNPYEIAPWSYGAIDVPVPVYLLADFFTAEATALFF